MTDTMKQPIWHCAFCGYPEHVVDGDWTRALRRRAEHEAQCNMRPTDLLLTEGAEREIAWQPIETAPKHGEVLVWVQRAGLKGILVAHQMAAGFSIEDHPAIDGGWYFWTGYQFALLKDKPTHWKPLPEPPK